MDNLGERWWRTKPLNPGIAQGFDFAHGGGSPLSFGLFQAFDQAKVKPFNSDQ
jgi:hypothetical protein